MFKPLAALLAASTFALPATAKVDPGTPELLRTLNEYGVTVLYNPSECDGTFNGSYHTSKVMKLCYSGAPDANDYDTIRHEAFHFLQHCAAIRRGTNGIRPLAINPSERQQFVSEALSRGHIASIKDAYPTHNHQIELEAFAAAETYTARELISYIRSWCIK